MRVLRRLANRGLVAAVLSLAAVGTAAPQGPSAAISAPAEAERAVRDAEAARLKAFLDHDVKAMSALLADEMIHVTSDGRTRNKTQFMDDFVNRPTGFSQFVTDDMEVIVVGDVAITRGRYHNLVAQRAYGTPLKYARFLRVWVTRNGAWQLLSHQATEVAQAGRAR
jgi:ketosteroid isomerase-like protein